MSPNRLWTLGAAVLALCVAALGYFFGISPQLAARSTAQSTLASVQTSNAQLAEKVSALASESRKLSTLQAQFDALSNALPSSSATPSFVTQLGAAASSSGVTLAGITISDAAPYAAPAAPAAPAASSSAAATPAPTSQAAASAGMPPFTSSEVTGNTLAVIPVTIQATGSYAAVLRFVKAVQNMQRYYLVTGITTSPGTGSGAGSTTGAATASNGVTASLTGDIFSITGQAASAPTSTPAPTP